MHRCKFDCQIGQCYQWTYSGDDHCYYHKGVKNGIFVAGESYGEDMIDE